MVRQEVIDKNPNVLYELTSSLVKSGEFINSNRKEASVIGADFLSQSTDVIEKVLTEPKDRIITNELMPVLEDLDRIQTYMSEKMTAVTGKIDVEKFVDLRYAKDAKAK